VRANVASVMCSYNKFNTTWSCESEALLTGLLKDEIDFQGYIVSGKKPMSGSLILSNLWM
jgi:beta-glucosidase